MKQKIYISGKITGLNYRQAYKNFEQAEQLLKSMDFEVINPMKKVSEKEGKTWEEYMLEDIGLLFNCDGIFMLRNWKDSKGARIEYNIANEKNLMIHFQESLNELPANKQVLKLDKNFHVYVHGNREFMGKGHCPLKGDYLKLYYKQIQ
jgi:hypothetical protein